MKLRNVIAYFLMLYLAPSFAVQSNHGEEREQANFTTEMMSVSSKTEATAMVEILQAKGLDAAWVPTDRKEMSYRMKIRHQWFPARMEKAEGHWLKESLVKKDAFPVWGLPGISRTSATGAATIENDVNAELSQQSTTGSYPQTGSGAELVVQVGHIREVKVVVFSRDGRLLASGSADRTLKLWDVSSRRELRTLIGHTASINSIAFSPDSSQIVSAGADQTVRLWDTKTGKEIYRLNGRFGGEVSAVFSPDGKQIASTNETLSLWDAKTGVPIKTVANQPITTAAYSPDGKYLAGATMLESRVTITLWDTRTGAEVRAFPRPFDTIRSIAFSPDGKLIVSASGNTITVCETATGKEIRSFTHRAEAIDKIINTVVFSPNGKLIASGAGTSDLSAPTVKIWDIVTGEERSLDGQFWVNSLAFSPDGKHLASGSKDTTIKMWDIETATEKLTMSHNQRLYSVAFSPDSKRLASGAVNDTIKVWDIESGKLTQTISGYISDFSKDGRQIVTGDGQGRIKLWDRETGAEIKLLAERMAGSITCLEFSPDGDIVAVTIEGKGTIILLDIKTGDKKIIAGRVGRLQSAVFSPDGKQIVSAGYSIRLWDTQTGAEIKSLSDNSKRYNSVGFSSDGRLVVAGGEDQTIKLWNVETGEIVRAIKEKSTISSVTFSPDNRQIISATTRDRAAKVWDVDTGKEIRSLGGHNEPVLSAKFSPDGRYIASGSGEGTVKLWKVQSKTETTLGGDSISITSIAISPDDKRMAIATSWENDTNQEGYAVKLWNLETGKLIRTLKHSAYITSVAFSPDGRRLASGSRGTGILLWDLENDKEFRSLPIRGEIRSLLFSRDSKILTYQGSGSYIVAKGPIRGVGQASSVYLLNAETGESIAWPGKYEDYDDDISSIAFSPNGKQIATGGRGKVTIRDAVTGAKIDELIVQGERAAINTVIFSPDGTILVAGIGNTYRGKIHIWDVRSKRLAKSVETQSNLYSGSTSASHSVSISPDSKQITIIENGTTISLLDALTGNEIQTFSGHTALVNAVAFLSDGKRLISGSSDRKTKIWDVKSGKESLTLFALDEGNWAVVTPEGQFDTNKLDDPQGLHWLLPDAPYTPASFEVFMRDYYEPRLLSRILAGEKMKAVRNLQSLNRVQPSLSNLVVSAPDPTGTVTVTVDVASQTSDSQRDATGKLLTSGVYDLRLFRDGQLVGYTTTKDAPLEATDEMALIAWRQANEVRLVNGKKTLSFRVSLPRVAGKSVVEFSAYAFNADRVKSETVRTTYKIPASLSPLKGRAYVITLSTNAYENPALNLRFAANDGRQVQSELVKRLLARGEYSEVVGVPLLSDYEVRRGARSIPAAEASTEDLRAGQKTVTEKSATKANFQTVLSLLAGKAVPAARLAGIPNAEKLRAARPEDVLIIHVSSHGYSDETGRFYLVTYDTGTGSIPALLARSVSSDELSWWLRDIDAGDMTLIVDACQSAAAVAGQGFKPGPMGSRGLGQLAYDKGMRVLAATQADNVALGHGSIKQGLLTYALVHEGLELGMADYKPENKTILLSEWLVYATERVPQLFEDVLRGQMRSRSQAGSLATTAADTKILVYPQTGNNAEQRILLQGKPLNTNKTASTEGQIQRPALFDFARQQRDVILVR